MSAPPQIRLIGLDGTPVTVNTHPHVGQAITADSMPVVLAKGMLVTQSFVSVPLLDKTNSVTFSATLALIVNANPNRRYLKIINNGPFDVELWNTIAPNSNQVGLPLPRGEVIFAGGDGLVETDTCRIGAVWATSVGGLTGLLVLEG